LAKKRQQNGRRIKTLPFKLSRSLSFEKQQAQAEQDKIEKTTQEQKPSTTPRPMLPSPRDTLSARLKREQIEARIRERENKMEKEEEENRKRLQKHKELCKKIQRALKQHQQVTDGSARQHGSDNNEAKERFKASTQSYMRQLKQMYHRLEMQPCMFERANFDIQKEALDSSKSDTVGSAMC
jgi:hypothetical protein